ncbi:cytochrome b [Aeromonas enteropelogenes]|uniref:Cytochrome b/b6 domain-containing protein n=1 Tax=Aeromonas enteropelogenes TaxID=29489 RepID=A0ABU9J722_AEREN
MNRYSPPLIFIHWITAILVLTSYVTSGDPTKGRTIWDFLIGQIHVLSGSLLFILILCRLFLRLLLPVPVVKAYNQSLTLVVKASHSLLYIFLLLVPVAGLLELYTKAISFDHVIIELPQLELIQSCLLFFGNIHHTLGNLLITLVGLHAINSLWHHYYLKDNSLNKMTFR